MFTKHSLESDVHKLLYVQWKLNEELFKAVKGRFVYISNREQSYFPSGETIVCGCTDSFTCLAYVQMNSLVMQYSVSLERPIESHSLHFAIKMENRCSDLLKGHTAHHAEICHVFSQQLFGNHIVDANILFYVKLCCVFS